MISPPNRQAFIELLSNFPPQHELRAELLAVEECDTDSRRLVEYGAVGGERVQTFVLVLRQTRGLCPGILAIHHDGARRPYDVGKSEPAGLAGDPGLQYGLDLCRRGYVVICPDRFPFKSRGLARSEHRETFDRFRIFRESGLELTEDLYAACVANRTVVERCTLMGDTLFELHCGLDYLCAQPEVDDSRIGVIGHSAGGLLAPLIMFVDERVRVGVASWGTWLVRWVYGHERLRPINGFAGLLTIPRLFAWGEIDDVLAGIAPRPFLETGDPLSPDDLVQLTGKARACYADLKAA